MGDETLKRDLAELFNLHGIDSDTNTPDFILAEVAFASIITFRRAAKDRDDWRGIPPWSPNQQITVLPMDVGPSPTPDKGEQSDG